jgi:ketosteroid isomerase-like protein
MNQSAEVRAALLRYLEAIGKGEVATIERMLSSESSLRVIGTDPRERWSGHDEVVRLFKMQLSELGGFALKVDDPEGYEEGSVGWAAAKFTIDLGGNQIGARISTVFHQEGGEWKVVQSHASIGAANEEELGKELTTA